MKKGQDNHLEKGSKNQMRNQGRMTQGRVGEELKDH